MPDPLVASDTEALRFQVQGCAWRGQSPPLSLPGSCRTSEPLPHGMGRLNARVVSPNGRYPGRTKRQHIGRSRNRPSLYRRRSPGKHSTWVRKPDPQLPLSRAMRWLLSAGTLADEAQQTFGAAKPTRTMQSLLPAQAARDRTPLPGDFGSKKRGSLAGMTYVSLVIPSRGRSAVPVAQ